MRTKEGTKQTTTFLMMIRTLQQLALQWIPTEDVLRHNLDHLFGMNNRFVHDLRNNPLCPIDEYFLMTILNPGNTSFFWMMKFINKKIHRLPMNTAVLACWQEHYTPVSSLVAFAMRTHFDKVAFFVYTIEKHKNQWRDKIFRPLKSHMWDFEDWEYVRGLTLERIFYIESCLEEKIRQ